MAGARRIGEFELIDAVARMTGAAVGRGRRELGPAPAVGRPRPSGVRIGIGDDAALLSCGPRTLATVDTMVENVHFRRSWLSAAELGRRAYRVAVSDIAAMGGRPRYVLVALALPASWKSTEALAAMRALASEAARTGAALVGGNLSRAGAISFTITVLGEAGTRAASRSGARARHRILVSGRLGSAAAGVRQLRRGKRKGALVRAYRRPPLRLALGHALGASPSIGAMIDVSDGLVQDLRHLCEASGLRAELDTDCIPMSPALRREVRDPLACALTGGEDYELLLTSPASRVEHLCDVASGLGCALTDIGRMVSGAPSVTDRCGRVLEGGYRHF